MFGRTITFVALLATTVLGYDQAAASAWLKEKETEAGVHKLPSGLLFKVLRKGDVENGKSPNVGDQCSVHYTGTLYDGTKFDSSRDHGRPSDFSPHQIVKGWREALQLMREGDHWEVYIPAKLAYGSRGRPKIPADAPLHFEIQLVSVNAEGKSSQAASDKLEKALGKAYSDL